MKRNEINDLKTKTVDELKRVLLDSREELLKATHQASLGEVKNPNAAKNMKKNIARVLTFLSMKEESQKEVQAVK